jgi:hypothetical protein
MGELTLAGGIPDIAPFNGKLEIGLRALCVLTAAFPEHHTVERLTVFDYLIVHSDDVPDGPAGLHPPTPYRGGEILARRGVLQASLLLYQSRGLLERRFAEDGVRYVATEVAAPFLDALRSPYVSTLRERAAWVVERFALLDDGMLGEFVEENVGEWGAEFTMQSVLSEDEDG